jgi:hypothetical protein
MNFAKALELPLKSARALRVPKRNVAKRNVTVGLVWLKRQALVPDAAAHAHAGELDLGSVA